MVPVKGLLFDIVREVVADLLGEAVVWFALVPMSASPTSVQLPSIDTIDEGVATLVNGWQLRYAPVLDRRCTDAVDMEGRAAPFDAAVIHGDVDALAAKGLRVLVVARATLPAGTRGVGHDDVQGLTFL